MNLQTTSPEQTKIDKEFAELIQAIREELIDADCNASHESIGALLGRDRLWIARRLLPAGERLRVTVGINDVFALRYVLDRLEYREYIDLFACLKK